MFLKAFCLLLLVGLSHAPTHAEERMILVSRLIHYGASDSIRHAANTELQHLLREFLSAHPLPEKNLPDSILSISQLVAPDASFKLLTWMVPNMERTHFKYYGYLQQFDKKKQSAVLLELTDVSDTLSRPESARLKNGQWYGCLAYDIIQESKGKKKFYSILGWKGNDAVTTKKVIDVFSFPNNKLQVGYPLFKMGKAYVSRVIFEFTASATMSLRYEDKENKIVFDHLSVPANSPPAEGNMSRFAGPDGTYDALEFKKGRWILLKDIDIGTRVKPKDVKPVIPVPPEK